MRDPVVIGDGIDAPNRLRLEVLGRMELRAGEEQLQAVLVQPKRLALLVYIALRRPGGFVRRDELMGSFWAESTEGRGRAALRQALRYLRRQLGAEVVVNRGDAEVGIDTTALACDGLDFFLALERGDDEAAVECYGGDLLPGFVLEGVYEFDRWLQSERQRLRVAAIEAALRLGESAEEEGDLGRAADRVRWALRLEPTNEQVARRLISLLARAGNRAAAVAAYEALAERLAEDLELEPSPATVELFAAVRDASGAEGVADRFGRTKRLSPQRVLVLDLENVTGDADLDAVGRLAAETIAQGLATIPDIEVVPPLAVGVVPPDALTEIAGRVGSGTILSGSFHLEEDTLRFQVRFTDVVGAKLLPGPEPVHTDRSSPLDGVERLRERVMTTLGPALTRRAVHVREAARPPSIQAYRAYLEGFELFIRREWRSALVHFRRSADLEPAYALPRVVCAIAHWNLGELEEARATAMEADDLRDALGAFERAVLDMVLAWLSGDWAAARRAAALQAATAPGSIPHFQVAEEARRLNRPREAREVLGRLDPEAGELRGWIFYWVEATTAHHLIGDHARELELASRCRHLHPDDSLARLLELRALAGLGRAADVVRVAEQALSSPTTGRPQPGELLVEAGLELRAHGSGEAAHSLLDRAVTWYRDHGGEDGPDPLRREFGRALYHAGRLGEARSIFQDLARTSGGRVQPIGYHHGHLQAHLDEGYLAVIAATEDAATEDAARENHTRPTTRWYARLEELDRPFLYGAQWFWMAAVAALQDDRERAVRMLRRAFADGLPLEMFIHTDPHLAGLRGYGPFDALMRPRG